MFDREQFRQVDPAYFNIITAEDMDVTIQSRNTGHYWYLHCTDYPSEGDCVIFHKHKFSHPYHQHGKGKSLGKAVGMIRRHDAWVMKKMKQSCLVKWQGSTSRIKWINLNWYKA